MQFFRFKRADQEETSFAHWLVETVVLVGLAFLLAMTIRAAVAEAFEVPSGSMEPTIMTHDRILADKLSPRFSSPRVGDVVVVKNPMGGQIPFVKRVIALQGQTVDVRDHAVWVDGKKLSEPYTHGLPSDPQSVLLPVTVPPGYVWLMGDNRTNSGDSRSFGAVPASSVIGKALFVFWPPAHLRGMD
jgi:signal peptidase I